MVLEDNIKFQFQVLIFWDAPLAQTPINFRPNMVFGKLLPVPKLCEKVCSTCASEQCVSSKKKLIF